MISLCILTLFAHTHHLTSIAHLITITFLIATLSLTKKNYEELPQLYNQFHSRGLEILAFPCNQFGGQEPGTHQEILDFVRKFDPDMDNKLVFFEKADVNGPDAREVFTFLKEKLVNEDESSNVRWNFGELILLLY
jgi:glutathione peroxidase-family protein